MVTDGKSDAGNVVMDVTRVLEDAWRAVGAASIPEKLEVVAFEQAVGLIAGAQTGGSPAGRSDVGGKGPKTKPQSNGSAVGGSSDSSAAAVGDEDAFFATFSSESGVGEERLRKVYFVKDGRARVAMSKSKLGSTEAERNRAVATLLAGIRWYVEGRQSVPIGEIRDAASAIPYEVSRNLAAHLDKVDGTMPVGAKNDKAVRVRTDKFGEPFAVLIEKLAGN